MEAFNRRDFFYDNAGCKAVLAISLQGNNETTSLN